MVQVVFRLPEEMVNHLEIMSKETKTNKSQILRDALDSSLEDYFTQKYLIPKIYAEWAEDNFKTYPIEQLLEEYKDVLAD